jgi:hypothetical protein
MAEQPPKAPVVPIRSVHRIARSVHRIARDRHSPGGGPDPIGCAVNRRGSADGWLRIDRATYAHRPIWARGRTHIGPFGRVDVRISAHLGAWPSGHGHLALACCPIVGVGEPFEPQENGLSPHVRGTPDVSCKTRGSVMVIVDWFGDNSNQRDSQQQRRSPPRHSTASSVRREGVGSVAA